MIVFAVCFIFALMGFIAAFGAWKSGDNFYTILMVVCGIAITAYPFVIM